MPASAGASTGRLSAATRTGPAAVSYLTGTTSVAAPASAAGRAGGRSGAERGATFAEGRASGEAQTGSQSGGGACFSEYVSPARSPHRRCNPPPAWCAMPLAPFPRHRAGEEREFNENTDFRGNPDFTEALGGGGGHRLAGGERTDVFFDHVCVACEPRDDFDGRLVAQADVDRRAHRFAGLDAKANRLVALLAHGGLRQSERSIARLKFDHGLHVQAGSKIFRADWARRSRSARSWSPRRARPPCERPGRKTLDRRAPGPGSRPDRRS